MSDSRTTSATSVETDPAYNSLSALVDLHYRVNSAIEAHLKKIRGVGKKVYYDELVFAPKDECPADLHHIGCF